MPPMRHRLAIAGALLLLGPRSAELGAQRVPVVVPRTITKTAGIAAGPAPVIYQMASATPLFHYLFWAAPEKDAGVAGYRIFSRPNANAPWTPRTPNPITLPVNSSWQWIDTGLVAPGASYRLSALYSDGRQGDAEYTFANPQQPAVPAWITATLVGIATAKLAWQPLQQASYRLFGSGQPASGTLLQATTITLANLSAGVHSWQIVADYGGVHGPGPTASVTITTVGHYRVVANGFRVMNHTNDVGGLVTDGAGDEVYGGFATFHVARPQGQLLDKDLRRSVVHGDAGSIPNRVKAGTASLQGGLTNADAVPPVLDPSQRYGQPAGTLTFPFLVWDGTLTNATDAVIILPTLWESDPVKGDANTASFTNWFLTEQSELPKVWADLMVQQAIQGKAIGLTTPPGWTYLPAFNPAFSRFDHPIGSMFDQGATAALGGMGKRVLRRALVLTRESIEAALFGGSNGIVTVPFVDQGAQGVVGNGHYILYLQVERVP